MCCLENFSSCDWGTNMRLTWGLVHHWMSDGKKGSRQGERVNHSVPSAISAFRRSLTWGISLGGFALSPKLLDHFPSWVLHFLLQTQRLGFLRFPSLATIYPYDQSHSPAAGFPLCPQLQGASSLLCTPTCPNAQRCLLWGPLDAPQAHPFKL